MLSEDNVNSMELKFKGNLENIKFARNTCAMFLHTLDLTTSFVNEIKMVISEGVTNSIVHGYENVENDIVIKMDYKIDEVNIEIIDYGVGIPDIDLARTVMYTTKPSEERSGLGFTIMEMFLDSLIVESKVNEGTTLRCKKLINEWEFVLW